MIKELLRRTQLVSSFVDDLESESSSEKAESKTCSLIAFKRCHNIVYR